MFKVYARPIIAFVCLTLIVLLAEPVALAASSGTVEGTVRDAQTGDPLPGANVMILKTSLGASTDMDGKFIIRNVPSGLPQSPGGVRGISSESGDDPGERRCDPQAGVQVVRGRR
ncbi:MAG: carboxypeptidase-like regulatory domain-containing protein [Ignavibacteriae bacterium]|nr:carboxypeptidase-like regulatory domain-containing protein [Ignavibacteriota bacterium]